MFADQAVTDFQAVLVTNDDALETLVARIEIRRGEDETVTRDALAGRIRQVFEVTPRIETLALGTLAKEFEASIKAPRFVDRRE